MAGAHSEHNDAYEHGSMDVTEQVKTFKLFAGLMTWNAYAFAIIVLFLTVWFMPGGSFLPALISAAVAAAAGWWYLRRKPAGH